MSGPFSQPSTVPASGVAGAPAGFGQAMGNQAQMGLLLQLLQDMLLALQGNVPGQNFFKVYPATVSGDLDIATTYPNVTSGIFSIRKTVAAATQITLPAKGGPWGIADGNGTAGTYPITVIGPGGYTFNGDASAILDFNWQFSTFVLDGTNFLTGL